MPLTLAVPSQTTMATSFVIQPQDVTGTQITFHYDTLPGNQPNSYGNTVYLWQTSSQMIPINTTPLNSQAIASNQPNGSNVFMGLSVSEESYLVAFAVGGAVSNIVSTVFIPATGSNPANPQSSNSTLNITNVGSTSVSFAYNTPPGSQPLANGDWVGLWQGQSEAGLYTLPPTWSAQLASNSNQGNWGLNLASGNIQRGTIYTLGYFKGGYAAQNPKQTTLTSTSTFFG
jgi:hypothetical protein